MPTFALCVLVLGTAALPVSTAAVVLGVALWVSVVVSGFEAAFLARAEDGAPPSGAVAFFQKHPHRLWATVMVANTLANVVFLVGAFALSQRWGAAWGVQDAAWWPYLQVGITAGVLILVGELMPKAHAVARTGMWIKGGGPFIRGLHWLLWPVVAPVAALSHRLLREPTPQESALTYDELRHAIEIAQEDDSPAEEKRILRGLVDLGTLAVRDLMLPVERVVALRANYTLAQVHRAITAEGFSRFPVVGGGWADVRGVLYAKDLLPGLSEAHPPHWLTLVRPAFFVNEGQRINKVLQDFRTQRLHLALVRDTRGRVVGLITLQDILDEIFGEMQDEFDAPAEFAPMAPMEWRFDARLPFAEVAQMTNMPTTVWPGDPATAAGVVVQSISQSPEPLRRGQTVAIPGWAFEVITTDLDGTPTQFRVKPVSVSSEPEGPAAHKIEP